MDNLLRPVHSIRALGVFTDTLPAGQKSPTAATRDIAAAAVRLLLDRSWTGAGSVPVFGAEDLSPNDMARTMSEVLGTPVHDQQQTLDDLGATLTSYRMGEAFTRSMVDMVRAKGEGLDDGVQRTPQTTRARRPSGSAANRCSSQPCSPGRPRPRPRPAAGMSQPEGLG